MSLQNLLILGQFQVGNDNICNLVERMTSPITMARSLGLPTCTLQRRIAHQENDMFFWTSLAPLIILSLFLTLLSFELKLLNLFFKTL